MKQISTTILSQNITYMLCTFIWWIAHGSWPLVQNWQRFGWMCGVCRTLCRAFSPSPMDSCLGSLLTKYTLVFARRQLGFESSHVKVKAQFIPWSAMSPRCLDVLWLHYPSNGLVGKLEIGRLRPQQAMVMDHWPMHPHVFWRK